MKSIKKVVIVISVFALFFVACLVLSGCGKDVNQANGNPSHEVVDNRSTEEQESAEELTEATEKIEATLSDNDFEIKEYLYEDSYSTNDYLIIKNNSKYDVEISGNAIAKDKDGNAIGASDLDEIDVLGPGQTSIGYFHFSDVKGVKSVEYSLNYKTDIYYKDVLSSLAIKETVNNSNVIVTVTNNASFPAEYVKAYALFFDAAGKVVNEDHEYTTDTDSEIKPGSSLSAQLSSREAFDHVEVYLTGRASK